MTLSFETLTPAQAAYMVLSNQRDSGGLPTSTCLKLNDSLDILGNAMAFKDWLYVYDAMKILSDLAFFAWSLEYGRQKVLAPKDTDWNVPIWSDNDQAAFTAQFN